ncbi:MAG: Uma2 family endonuclease [Pseudanabaenales cyanobacterium]|nr:Uma2 family endonuclease [Pseudanabaenales cyanobacterium]
MTPSTSSSIVISKWTLDEYHQMIDAGILSDRPVELLNGEIIEMPPEGKPHAHLSSNAADYFRELLHGRAKIREGKPITLPNHSEPEPDIAVVQDLGDTYLEHHPYPENIFWVVEYSDSSLTKDLEVKPKIYAQAGIPEYWATNLKRMELVVFRDPSDDDYREKRTLIEGDIRPVAFPDVVISVGRLLRRRG